MTPNELLESVKKVITPQLLIDDNDLLSGLLSQALMTFGAKVGAIANIRLNETDLNPDFTWLRSEEIYQIFDKDQDLMDYDLDGSSLTVETNEYTVFPLKALYLVDFNNIDLANDEVPREAHQFVFEYTKALIDMPNIQRVRDAYEGSQLSTEGLPTVADYRTTKEALDTALIEMTLVLPPVSVIY